MMAKMVMKCVTQAINSCSCIPKTLKFYNYVTGKVHALRLSEGNIRNYWWNVWWQQQMLPETNLDGENCARYHKTLPQQTERDVSSTFGGR